MISIKRELHFCSGHRVYLHESKCNHLHGHNYEVWIHARAPELDEIGRVIDFGIIKDLIGKWIDENWDHGFIVWEHDLTIKSMLESLYLGHGKPKQKMYVLSENPTAENMAAHLLRVICPKLLEGTNVEVFQIDLFETPRCCATVTLDGDE